MKVVAHRGNAPGFREHTRAGFLHALNLPIHGIEFDVRLSADQRLMIQHDATVTRTTGRVGRVSAMHSSELRRLNIGTAELPQQMLMLEDILEMHQDHPDKHLYIEIKHPTRFAGATEQQVVRHLRRAGLVDDPRIHVISFAHFSIRRMRQIAPQIDRIYLRHVWEPRINPADILMSRPTGLGLPLPAARWRPDLVAAHGLPTYMWTPNTTRDILFALGRGVEILATDDPEHAAWILDGHEDESPRPEPDRGRMSTKQAGPLNPLAGAL